MAETAGAAFSDALGVAVLVAAGVALAGSVFIVRFMPPRHLPQDGGSWTDAG